MKKNYRITVNFPILVGDSDISTSSLLPKYEKFENISDLQDEPPLYSMVAGENSLWMFGISEQRLYFILFFLFAFDIHILFFISFLFYYVFT